MSFYLNTSAWFFIITAFSLIIHEVVHALVANFCGDDTAIESGALSLNPRQHFDLLGAIVILILSLAHLGVGWTKSYSCNASKFRNSRVSSFLIALSGPLTHFFIAFLSWWLLKYLGNSTLGAKSLSVLLKVNLSLGFFHLLPLYPLDGLKIFSTLLPRKWSAKYDFMCLRYGSWPLLFLIAVECLAFLTNLFPSPWRWFMQFVFRCCGLD